MARRHRLGGGSPALTLAQQTIQIQWRFPGFVNRGRPGSARWVGKLQPSMLGTRYNIRVHYALGDIPRVFVIEPKLAVHAPHVYWDDDGRLCLYYPKESPWSRDMVIAETIFPWTALWLRYYELWLDTGKWLGPSPHGDAVGSQELTNAN